MYSGDLRTLLKCHKPGGCSMWWEDSPEGSGVPLGQITYRYAEAEFACESCKSKNRTSIAALIKRLETEKLGNSSTLHTNVAGLLKKPCTKCQQARWAFRVTWPDPANLTLGERRRIEELDRRDVPSLPADPLEF